MVQVTECVKHKREKQRRASGSARVANGDGCKIKDARRAGSHDCRLWGRHDRAVKQVMRFPLSLNGCFFPYFLYSIGILSSRTRCIFSCIPNSNFQKLSTRIHYFEIPLYFLQSKQSMKGDLKRKAVLTRKGY